MQSQRLLLSALSACLVSSAVKAEDVNNIASPNAVGNSSIINQNMQVNQGATSKNYFGRNVICSQPSMSFTPFYTGNDSQNPKEQIYTISEGWGFQLSYMVPLGNSNDQCSELATLNIQLAKEELNKQKTDKQLVRVLKCSQLHASGYMIHPKSPMAGVCGDVVNIRSFVKKNPSLFETP